MNELDQALLLAIELLRKQIADLPLAMAQNAERAARASSGDANAKAWAIPLPPRDPPTRGERAIAAANDAVGGAARRLTSNANLLGSAFGRLLGPVASLDSVLGSSTSGMTVLQGSLSLLANAVGSVALPVFYTLAVGATATSDVLTRKVIPSLGDLSKWVLSTGIPAMEQLADAAGKAADLLKLVADSKIGKLAAGDDRGGALGGTNRLIDRLTGDGEPGVKRDESATGLQGGVAWMKSLHRSMDDVATAVGGRAGEQTAGAKNWMLKKLGPAVFGGNESDFDPYSGVGTNRGAQGDAGKATDKARMMAMQELMFQMNPRTRIGSVTGNWSAAQQASLGLSPFQRETLDIQRKTLAELIKANAATPGGAAYSAGAPPGSGGTGEGLLAAAAMRAAEGR